MSRVITQKSSTDSGKFRVPCGYGIPEDMLNIGIANQKGRANQDLAAFQCIKNNEVKVNFEIAVESKSDDNVECKVKCIVDKNDYLVFGMFDGHGGRKYGDNDAAIAGARVINSLSDPKNKYGLTGAPDAAKILNAIHKEAEETVKDTTGSTATILVVHGRKVKGLILGDSSVYIFENGVIIRKITGPSFNDEAVRARVISKGGEMFREVLYSGRVVWRIVNEAKTNGVVTSSGIGDFGFIGMDRDGEPFDFELADGQTLLVATDGLDSDISSRDIEGILRKATVDGKGDLQTIANLLASRVFHESGLRLPGTPDDIALILYQPKARDEVANP
jgi:serine/threonine protein phosphatase PrpC